MEQIAVDDRERVRLRADARCAGNDLMAVQIGDRMHPAARRNDASVVIAVHVTQPGELAAVKLNLRRLVDFLLDRRAPHHADVGPVLRQRIVELIGERHAAGGRNVLHDDVRITGNIFAEMARQRANVDVVAAAGAVRRTQRKRMRLVELRCVLAGRGRGTGEGQDQDRRGAQKSLHGAQRRCPFQSQ